LKVLPTREQCLTLLKEENCSPEVIEHCIAVESLAVSIARRCSDDSATIETVSRGALLHDIGRSRTHGIMHAIVGADICRSRGLDETIALIVERHIGAGLTGDEALALGLPKKDYMPETLVEKIVTQADNLVGEKEHATIRMPLAVAVEKAREKDFDVLAERMTLLHEELSQACGIDIDEIE
jgi:tRNA (cytidine56-2'-O)-methyltransferase